MVDVKAPEGVFEGKVFKFPARVYYEDTDAGGLGFFSYYLKFAGRGRN